MIIKSRENKIFKDLKKLLAKKYRLREKLFLVEGKVAVLDSISYKRPKIIAISENIDEDTFLYLNENFSEIVYMFKEELFNQLSDSQNPQKVIAYFDFIHNEFNKSTGRYIYCDDISEPGNLGGIIRSAVAFNLDGVILSKNCVDIYNPKTIRATMSSIFKIDIFTMDKVDLVNSNFDIFATTPHNAKNICKVDFPKNFIVVMGNESSGVDKIILDNSTENIKIEINSDIESLNVNVAASIVMYEINKIN